MNFMAKDFVKIKRYAVKYVNEENFVLHFV